MTKRFLPLTLALVAAPAFAQDAAEALRVDAADGDTLLTLHDDGGFVVRGTYGVGMIPAEGTGARLMWYPGKAAFRAGQSDFGEWDDANVGLFSFAAGQRTIASGRLSAALGGGSEASGMGSFAAGFQSDASGEGATSLGQSTASGFYSTAFGSGIASAAYSAAFGRDTKASGEGTVAFGSFTEAQASGSFVFGRFNVVAGTPGEWVATEPLFVAGNGASDTERSNALTLSKNGDLDIAGQLSATGVAFPDGTIQTTAASGDGSLPENANGALDLSDEDGFVAEGTYSVGAIPAEGPGTRLMWYPGKAAFRAGDFDAEAGRADLIGDYSTAFGDDAIASGKFSFAAGDRSIASGSHSVALGESAEASATGSVAAGYGAEAAGSYAVALGKNASASGGQAFAFGADVVASGIGSVAIGQEADTNEKRGAFVFTSNFTVYDGDGYLLRASRADEFSARFEGGYRLFTSEATTVEQGTPTGVALAPGGTSWETISDRRRKENLLPVDGEATLAGLRGLELTTWNYIGQDAARRHVGPMAQDFHAAFGRDALGTIGTDTTLATQDVDGVLFVAAQALEARTTAQAEEITALRERIAALEAQNAALAEQAAHTQAVAARLARIEAALAASTAPVQTAALPTQD